MSKYGLKCTCVNGCNGPWGDVVVQLNKSEIPEKSLGDVKIPGNKGSAGNVRLVQNSPKVKPEPPDGNTVSVQFRPAAGPAVVRKRHWKLGFSFLILVVLPIVVSAWYLWQVARDQYASSTGFTVRQEQGATAVDLTGLSQFIGGPTSSDTDILYEFIQSQDIVQRIHERIDLKRVYTETWEQDPLFSLWPDASVEDMRWYWNRVVRVAYDQNTGLIELQVRAFSADDAQQLAAAIVDESQAMVNDLNAAAREDLMQYAMADLEMAYERLRQSRLALTDFRTRTKIVDPMADIQGRMGILNGLQLRLTDALVEFDLLNETTQERDPRLIQARRRIDVIRTRISEERDKFAHNESTSEAGDYASLLSEFEGLTVDLEYAAESYTVARGALDLARSNANRQTRYLATYIHPTLAQSAEFPQRIILLGLITLFVAMGWGILVLVYYSLRDRR